MLVNLKLTQTRCQDPEFECDLVDSSASYGARLELKPLNGSTAALGWDPYDAPATIVIEVSVIAFL